MIQLDIVSDPICPWCYIGKAHLDAGLAEAKTDPFTPVWRPFQLNPDMPVGGMDRAAYLEAKFGGRDGAARVYGAIEQAAAVAGLEVNFSRISRTPNTFDTHRLIRWALTTGNQGAVVTQLFTRYFTRGEDISDRDLLLDVGVSAGLEREVLARLFEGPADREEVAREEAGARAMGVNGVPTFVIGGRNVLTGAQPPETWARVAAEITAALAAQADGDAQTGHRTAEGRA